MLFSGCSWFSQRFSRVSISEVNEALGAHFLDRDARTVGGLVTARLRHLPK
ncbi:MAG: transporter associated domain-containing protein, partial [Gammaproteobacteria bacterium]